MENTSGKIISSRRDDITLVICQNNDDKTLIISSANDPNNTLKEIALFDAEGLVGKDIREILPQPIKENIDDYLEFEDMGNDLASVISKSRDFGIINKSGDFVGMNTRIQRDASPDKHAYFVMAMQTKSNSTGRKSIRVLEILKENQIIDKTTEVAEKTWFIEEAEIANFYADRKKITASFAVITIDDFENVLVSQGEKPSETLAADMAAHCNRTFRSSDIIGYLGEGKFGIVMIGADQKNSQVPLNRLRWENANRQDSKQKTISIAFRELGKGQEEIEETLDECLKILKKHEGESNQIFAA